jgi:hypothetical protein
MRVRRPDKERAPAGWRPRPLVLTGDPLGAGLLGGAALAPFFVVVAFRIYLPYRWGCEESGPWQMQVPGLREACISSQPEGHLSHFVTCARRRLRPVYKLEDGRWAKLGRSQDEPPDKTRHRPAASGRRVAACSQSSGRIVHLVFPQALPPN